ncbi:MAG: sulfite exporter TauE/SafE family protein [Pseudomonadota bacterium]
MPIFDDLSLLTLAVICVAALATSAVHGATGVAGGFLMTAVLASVIGVKPVVPVMSVALLISHSSRALLNLPDFNKRAFFAVTLVAVPCIVAGALIYGRMSSSLVAAVLGTIVLISIPLRRWAMNRKVRTSTITLNAVGAVYGALSGVSIGPGMLLIPFMLGYGLAKEAFVATLAAIALVTNVTRLTVFGASDLLDMRYLALGILIGLLTIPGNWLGRTVLRRMTNAGHATLVDVLTVIGALNFFWLALR